MDPISVRAREIAEIEHGRLIDSTPVSHALYQRALKSMPLGVGASFQVGDPYPIYLRDGHGAGSAADVPASAHCGHRRGRDYQQPARGTAGRPGQPMTTIAGAAASRGSRARDQSKNASVRI